MPHKKCAPEFCEVQQPVAVTVIPQTVVGVKLFMNKFTTFQRELIADLSSTQRSSQMKSLSRLINVRENISRIFLRPPIIQNLSAGSNLCRVRNPFKSCARPIMIVFIHCFQQKSSWFKVSACPAVFCGNRPTARPSSRGPSSDLPATGKCYQPRRHHVPCSSGTYRWPWERRSHAFRSLWCSADRRRADACSDSSCSSVISWRIATKRPRKMDLSLIA